MTNYNERFDKILKWYDNNRNSAFQHARDIEADSIELDGLLRGVSNEAKQALTSLMKELVAEAKPKRKTLAELNGGWRADIAQGFNESLDAYEQNLLKALEEV